MKRVDYDKGLVAEFILAQSLSLAPMRFTYDSVAAHSCSVNACYRDFYEQCPDAWKRILNTWQVDEPFYSKMLEGALESCPNVSTQTAGHASNNQASQMNLTHPPEHVMLHRLREPDTQFLNRTLADLEE